MKELLTVIVILICLRVIQLACLFIYCWQKQVREEKFYNKQGQECTKEEMEAELTWKLEKSLIRPIPSEEAFD